MKMKLISHANTISLIKLIKVKTNKLKNIIMLMKPIGLITPKKLIRLIKLRTLVRLIRLKKPMN